MPDSILLTSADGFQFPAYVARPAGAPFTARGSAPGTRRLPGQYPTAAAGREVTASAT